MAAMRTPTKGPLGRAAASVQELGKELSAAETPPAATPAPGRAMRGGPPVQPNVPLPVEVVDPPRSGLQYTRDITKAFIAPVSITGIVLIFTVFMLLKGGFAQPLPAPRGPGPAQRRDASPG